MGNPLKHTVTHPEVGYVFTDDGHEYVAATVTPHRTRAGEDSFAISWIGTCASCGQPFGFVTGPRVYTALRRCEGCRSGVKPVGRKVPPFSPDDREVCATEAAARALIHDKGGRAYVRSDGVILWYGPSWSDQKVQKDVKNGRRLSTS